MEAISRELSRRDVLPDVAALRALGQKVPDELVELSLRAGDVLTPVQKRRELGAVVLVLNDGERLEHGFQPLDGGTGLVPDAGELFEVAGDLINRQSIINQ